MKLSAIVFTLCLGVASSRVIFLGSDPDFGVITSPGFPDAYPANLDVTWVLTAEPGYQVELYFTVFDIEDSFDVVPCAYDFLRIDDGKSNQTFCGNEVDFFSDSLKFRQRFVSKDSVMAVRFVTDFGNGDFPVTGFRGHYSYFDKDECYEQKELVRNTVDDWDQLVTCNHFCVNAPGSYYCTCRAGFFLRDDGHTCSPICSNVVLTSDSGIITSSEYPNNYGRMADCDFTIEVRVGLTINLMFDSEFEIESHINYTQPDCVYDYLKISYGTTEQTYCGNTAPGNGETMDLSSRTAKLEFNTDSSVEMKGFKVRYQTTRIRCLAERPAPSSGQIVGDIEGSYEFEDKVTFRCNEGYEFEGFGDDVKVVVLTCRNDGTWDGNVPACRIKSCGIPVDVLGVPNSHIVGFGELTFTFGEMFSVECNEWYEHSNGAMDWICTDSKTWQPALGFGGQIPSCKPECGEKNFKQKTLVSHISGGTEAMQFEYPWIVALNRGPLPNIAGVDCSGSLISSEYLVTAAHCVAGVRDTKIPIDPQLLHAWLNAHDITIERFIPGKARNIGVRSVMMHEDYNPMLKDNDLALIRLSQTIVMDNITHPICVPESPNDFNRLKVPRGNGLVAGWGHSGRNDGKVVLLEAEIPTVSSSTCWQNFRDISLANSRELAPDLGITENMFCAGDPLGGGSTCQGDSGGPFMVKNNVRDNPRYYVQGIVSFGLDAGICGTRESYSVFTKVHQEFARWIRRNTDLE